MIAEDDIDIVPPSRCETLRENFIACICCRRRANSDDSFDGESGSARGSMGAPLLQKLNLREYDRVATEDSTCENDQSRIKSALEKHLDGSSKAVDRNFTLFKIGQQSEDESSGPDSRNGSGDSHGSKASKISAFLRRLSSSSSDSKSADAQRLLSETTTDPAPELHETKIDFSQGTEHGSRTLDRALKKVSTSPSNIKLLRISIEPLHLHLHIWTQPFLVKSSTERLFAGCV